MAFSARRILWVALILSGAVQAFAAEPAKVCVVGFFRLADKPYIDALDSVFRGKPDVTLTTTALPTDLLNCVENDAEEIVIVGHSMQSQSDAQLASLVWFSKGTDATAPSRVMPLLPFTFGRVHEILVQKRDSGAAPRLKRIRIMACQPQKVLARYLELDALTQELGIEVEFAPVNPLMSFLKHEEVVSVSKTWLRESLSR